MCMQMNYDNALSISNIIVPIKIKQTEQYLAAGGDGLTGAVAHDAGAESEHELALDHVMEHDGDQALGAPARPHLPGHAVPGQQVRVGILTMLVPVEILHAPETLWPLYLRFADHPPELHQHLSCPAIIEKSTRI